MKNYYFFLILFSWSIFFNAQTQIGQDIDGDAAGDQFGRAVALSADGSIVAIGATNNDANGINSGHVKVFENINGNWTQIGDDIDGENSLDRSGSSICLSSDGNIIAIGATGNDGNGSGSGHVRVFENINGGWIQIGQDIDGSAGSDQSGSTISLSSDGNIIAIGAPSNQENGSNSGQVRIYANQNNNWVQLGDDILGLEAETRLGRSVSLSADGSRLALNLAGFDEFGFDITRIYENQNNTWIQLGNDINGESVGYSVESKVSLSSNGTIVAFSSLGFNPDPNDPIPTSALVNVYEVVNGTWTQIGTTIYPEDNSDSSGSSSLFLSADGSLVAIGYVGNDGNGSSSGHVRVYANQNNIWTQLGEDIDGEGENNLFGVSVSISDDNSTIIIGAIGNSDNGQNAGHARVYNIPSLLSIENNKLEKFNIFPNPAKDQFTIQLENPLDFQEVKIYSQLGKLVLTSQETSITTQELSSGLYIVEVTTTRGRALRKLIIE